MREMKSKCYLFHLVDFLDYDFYITQLQEMRLKMQQSEEKVEMRKRQTFTETVYKFLAIDEAVNITVNQV